MLDQVPCLCGGSSPATPESLVVAVNPVTRIVAISVRVGIGIPVGIWVSVGIGVHRDRCGVGGRRIAGTALQAWATLRLRSRQTLSLLIGDRIYCDWTNQVEGQDHLRWQYHARSGAGRRGRSACCTTDRRADGRTRSSTRDAAYDGTNAGTGNRISCRIGSFAPGIPHPNVGIQRICVPLKYEAVQP